MNKRDFLSDVISRWRSDYNFRTFLSAGGSFTLTVIFALYNGFLGVHHHSIWNGSICAYYIVLSLIRGVLIWAEDRIYRKNTKAEREMRKQVFHFTSAALLVLNLAMFVPISLLVQLEKPVNMGLIPVLAMAAYTVYKLVFACLNYRKRRASSNVFVKELRSINLIDALLSIISLQNALISYAGGGDSMLVVSAASSAVLLIMIVAISIHTIRAGYAELI